MRATPQSLTPPRPVHRQSTAGRWLWKEPDTGGTREKCERRGALAAVPRGAPGLHRLRTSFCPDHVLIQTEARQCAACIWRDAVQTTATVPRGTTGGDAHGALVWCFVPTVRASVRWRGDTTYAPQRSERWNWTLPTTTWSAMARLRPANASWHSHRLHHAARCGTRSSAGYAAAGCSSRAPAVDEAHPTYDRSHVTRTPARTG